MVHRCARDCCEAPGHVQQPPGAPRPRRWCPRACHRPRILAGGDLRATQGPRATHGSAIRPESNYDGQASSHDGACEAGNARIVLHEAGSGPASARFQLRAPAAAPERPGGGAPPAGPTTGGPAAAARGFILRLRGGRNDHPAPSCAHVQALAHRTSSRAVRRATGGTDGNARTYFVLQKGLKVHLRQTSGGGVLPVMVCPAMRHMCRTPRSAVAAGHVGEAESTSAASMQLGNGWRLSVTSRTSPSSCRNRAAGTWAAHMPSGPRVGPRASSMLCGRAVLEAERRYR